MIILGINAYHADSSAAVIVDGKLIAAAEEERFRRVKHWAGFPSEAVRYCLAAAGVSAGAVDHVAVNRDPSANILKKAWFAALRAPSVSAIADRAKNASKIRELRESFEKEVACGTPLKAEFHQVEHHRAHLASAFFVSPFDEAAVVSVDGFGDFVSAMWGAGRKGRIEVSGQVGFPHSLGLFYLAMTQYLGFRKYGDEYKVMGLAAYGEPSETQKLRSLVKLGPKGSFELDTSYFLHQSEGVSMVWEGGEPAIGTVYSDKLEALLGPARQPEGEVTDRHKALAASAQAVYEEALFHLLRQAHAVSGSERLCLAGGCGLNSVANGKIYANTPFKKLYVQSAAGDAGGAIGAAFWVLHEKLRQPRSFVMDHAYWGPSYDSFQIAEAIRAREEDLRAQRCTIEAIQNDVGLCFQTAERIAEGKVVGWFQGRMEWGPRALGNRSILCDPRRANMKDVLNLKIKKRESFRPFAPAILREEVPHWFETDDDVPFMLQVYTIRPERRSEISAVTHVNGTGRLQTVTEAQNPLFHRLISTFGQISGVPILLNTSFNENEPVVCRPEEALDCFLRTKMDLLVMGNYFIERKEEDGAHG